MQPQDIVNVALYGFLKICHRGCRLFVHSAAVHGPAIIAVKHVDDVALLRIIDAMLIRIAPVIFELDVTSKLAGVTNVGAPPFALSFMNFGVRSSAESVDQLRKNFSRLGDTLLLSHRVRILRIRTVRDRGAEHHQHYRDAQKLHPHKTDPPFTLMTSPVRKLARSDARNRIGPATSSGVAGRPSGIAVAAIFWPFLVSR